MSYAAKNGFAPRNHPKQVGARGAEEKTDDRRTPASVFDPLHTEHGFTIDVAASGDNAKCARFFSRVDDGLTRSWAGEVAWCNPPYSDLPTWVRKAFAEVDSGCRKVVMLLPANRTEQRWWQNMVEPVRDRPGTGVTTKNLRGRLVFGGDYGRNGTHVPFGCVILIVEPGDRSETDLPREKKQ